MTTRVLLDAGPLGLVSNPRTSPAFFACTAWLRSLLEHGVVVSHPEIADYEVRRELLRARKTQGLARLDELKRQLVYLPITTEVMLMAAEFWAIARQRGRPTAADISLDADMILAAQAALIDQAGDHAVIATTNVRHLALFVDARRWQDIE